MEYKFNDIEQKWKQIWKDTNVYRVSNDSTKPKCYVLDMFPYPSGAGLHVGHPLGYIASDIYARYKRLCGFNVLHPMGYDAFGLPAEQYAIETGQHPINTTEKNIARYREQLDNIGFCYDWEREVRTSDPKYYRWTQWIFLQLFHSWYDRKEGKAKNIQELIAIFEQEGNANHACPGDEQLSFNAAQWNAYTETEKRNALMQYRLAYLDYANVWWCEKLGTVLANDEVVNGVSERGGFPVEKKKMRQWFLRITEYADRLLQSLDNLEWTDAMKEMQRNWIGKSMGAEIDFSIKDSVHQIKVFTTRPDTIFGVDFMVLAPEHEWVDAIATPAQQDAIAQYKKYVQSRSERERLAEVKQVSGCFTGAYAVHPLTGNEIPIWISEYVLAGYGTGAIMAVPSGDCRDHAFAKHFNIPITNIFGEQYTGDEAYESKEGTIENSGFISGIEIKKAAEIIINTLAENGLGKPKVNFKLRDAGFSRQRYWGEPFPIVYQNNMPYALDEIEGGETLPVELPMVESFKPSATGEGPLSLQTDWLQTPKGTRETNTMPGYAGSSWYFLRFMDPHNDAEFANRKVTDYWNQVDVYIGGTEHAVGHLLYSRFWTKVLFDLGHLGFEEPFKKLINQGMITAFSYFHLQEFTADAVSYRHELDKDDDSNKNGVVITAEIRPLITSSDATDVPDEVSTNKSILNKENIKPLSFSKTNNVRKVRIKDVGKFVEANGRIFKDKFEAYLNESEIRRKEYENILGINWEKTDDGREFIQLSVENEKMSKSKYNVVNPDDIVAQYGADTFRMYEMFLGPIDVSKPWDTKGIEGVHRFLKKLWRLYFDEQKGFIATDEKATDAELRVLHKTIKKIKEDIERFTLNTSVSQFMICVNELATLNCHKREILEPLAIIIAPFAPHLAEELWHAFGNLSSVLDATFANANEQYLVENSKLYPVAVNGKTRIELEFPLDAEQSFIEQTVLNHETIQKWLEGKQPKKIIFVKGKMINVVI